jgi:hypothetical protein
LSQPNSTSTRIWNYKIIGWLTSSPKPAHPAEVNKVANPTNLVGRKLFGSLGLTENISWKSLNFDVNISSLLRFLQKLSVKFYISAVSAFLVFNNNIMKIMREKKFY